MPSQHQTNQWSRWHILTGGTTFYDPQLHDLPSRVHSVRSTSSFALQALVPCGVHWYLVTEQCTVPYLSTWIDFRIHRVDVSKVAPSMGPEESLHFTSVPHIVYTCIVKTSSIRLTSCFSSRNSPLPFFFFDSKPERSLRCIFLRFKHKSGREWLRILSLSLSSSLFLLGSFLDRTHRLF